MPPVLQGAEDAPQPCLRPRALLAAVAVNYFVDQVLLAKTKCHMVFFPAADGIGLGAPVAGRVLFPAGFLVPALGVGLVQGRDGARRGRGAVLDSAQRWPGDAARRKPGEPFSFLSNSIALVSRLFYKGMKW